MGAMGKSAQFLLHTWLPDAMEGPTPVSALIHAATMVTAGVFMVARLSPLFEQSPTALTVVTIVGATTAFFAATVGLVQNDIKRVIAYSTCSQLGYMFVGLGVGGYRPRHLPPLHPRLLQGAAVPRRRLGHPRHAPRAGHARAWAAWRKKIPFTFWMMTIGTLALTGVGIPFTTIGFAGYFSKDAIIEAAYRCRTATARPTPSGAWRRGGLDLVLFLAPDVHDLLRQARRAARHALPAEATHDDHAHGHDDHGHGARRRRMNCRRSC